LISIEYFRGQHIEMAQGGVYTETAVPTFSRNYLASGGKRRLDDYYSRAYGTHCRA